MSLWFAGAGPFTLKQALRNRFILAWQVFRDTQRSTLWITRAKIALRFLWYMSV